MKEDLQQLDQYYNAIADEIESLDDFALDEAIANYMYMVVVGQSVSKELSVSAAELFSMAMKVWTERHPFTFPPCFESMPTKKNSASSNMFGTSFVYKWPEA